MQIHIVSGFQGADLNYFINGKAKVSWETSKPTVYFLPDSRFENNETGNIPCDLICPGQFAAGKKRANKCAHITQNTGPGLDEVRFGYS